MARITAARLYSTSFPTNENPISESGRWKQRDPNQTVCLVETIGGVQVCHGTMVGGPSQFDDSNASLTGFSINQEITGTVWKSASIPSTPNMEVEINLNWIDDGATRSTPYGDTKSYGYEINTNQNGDYLNIGKFKVDPALTSVVLKDLIGRAPATGDRFKGSVVRLPSGSAWVRAFWNDLLVAEAIDASPFSVGDPGVGFFVHDGGSNNLFGFSKIVASSIP